LKVHVCGHKISLHSLIAGVLFLTHTVLGSFQVEETETEILQGSV